MSGGGGGGGGTWRPTPQAAPKAPGSQGGGGGTPRDPCNINETTNLNSPDRTVLAGLRTGDVLTVEFKTGPPRVLVAVTEARAVAGSITSPSMPQVIQCIQQGWHYVAEVLAVRGAVCQIRIRPR